MDSTRHGPSFNTLATALGSSKNLLQQILGQVRHSYVDYGEELPSTHSSTQRRYGFGSDHLYRGISRDEERSDIRAYDPYEYERDRDRGRDRDRDRDRGRSSWPGNSRTSDCNYEQDRPYDAVYRDRESFCQRGDYEEDRRSDRMTSQHWDRDERLGKTDRKDAERRSPFFGGLLDKGSRERSDHSKEHSREPYWEKTHQTDLPYKGEWEQHSDSAGAREAIAATSYGFMDPMQIPPGALVRPHCYLEAPPLGMYKLPQREKPQGCRTAFVGGLPDMVDEVVINEVFFVCGPIESIKINKTKRGETDKKYCHVRFTNPESVDQAVLFAGYNLVIGDGKDRNKAGRFHVDYGSSKEDEREHEALERAKAKELWQKAIEQEANNAKSASTVFADHEATALLEKIRQEINIFDCLQVLEQWLDKGECNRKTASTFYSLLSSTHSHVKRLIKEKREHEELVKQQKQEQLDKAHKIKDQCGAIVKVFESACKKKAWDHFTKAQRRNITTWHKQVEEEVRINEEVQIQNRVEVGMELDEDEQPCQENIEQFADKEAVKTESNDGPTESKRAKLDSDGDVEAENKKLRSQVSSLKATVEQNTGLVWQVEGYKNEAEQFKQQYNWAVMEKNAQIARLTAALQGLQQFLQNVDIKDPLKDTHNLHILVTNGEVSGDKSVVEMDLEDEGEQAGKSTSEKGGKQNEGTMETEGVGATVNEIAAQAERNGSSEQVNSHSVHQSSEEDAVDDKKAGKEEEEGEENAESVVVEKENFVDSDEVQTPDNEVSEGVSAHEKGSDTLDSEEQGKTGKPDDRVQVLDNATKSDVTISGDVTESDVTISGGVTKSDDITISGDVTKPDDITITGDVISGDVTESDDVTVSGNVTESDDVTISGYVTKSDDITISGDVTKSDGVTISGGVTESDVTISGGVTKSDDITISGDVTKPDDVTISGDVTSDVTESRDTTESHDDNRNANEKEKEGMQAVAPNSADYWQSYYQSWNSFDWSGYSTYNNPANAIRLSGRELALVGVLCSFLHICPAGVTEEEVAGYVQRQVKGVEKESIQKLLSSLPMLFRAGDSDEGKKWKFCGFDAAQQ